MKIINTTRRTILAERAEVADSFYSRMVGLLKRKSFVAGEALVITHCQSIHMFFMKFAIDVIFADKNDRVVGLVRNIKPFRLSPVYFQASYAVEIPAGIIERSGTVCGDQLTLG